MMTIIVSYPTSVIGIIVLLRSPPKYMCIEIQTKIKMPKKNMQTPTCTIFVAHGIKAITHDG